MVAGSNLRVDIWRLQPQPDNEVGGAVLSGTVLHCGVMGFMQGAPPEQLVLQQGLEVARIFRMTILPGTLDVRERDEVEIVGPEDHPYYRDRFRVVGVRYSSHGPRDPRNYMILELNRNLRAHTSQ